MRIAVTGAAGFVGRHTCRALLAAGCEVTAVVRRGEAPAGTREARIAGLDDRALESAFVDCDAVVHLAARVHVMAERSADPLAEFRAVNVAGSERVYRAAVAAGAKRLVFLSSVKVHGEGREAPYAESDAPSPQDPYGRSKLEAEELLFALRARGGSCEVVVLRPPLVYGPGVAGNFQRLLGLAERSLRWPLPLGGLRNGRSLVSVDNLADAIRFVVVRAGLDGRTLLVSDGEERSTSQLIDSLARGMGGRARLVPCPTAMMRALANLVGRGAEADRLLGSLRVDSSALRLGLGWSPPQSMHAGLEEVARWWRARSAA